MTNKTKTSVDSYAWREFQASETARVQKRTAARFRSIAWPAVIVLLIISVIAAIATSLWFLPLIGVALLFAPSYGESYLAMRPRQRRAIKTLWQIEQGHNPDLTNGFDALALEWTIAMKRAFQELEHNSVPDGSPEHGDARRLRDMAHGLIRALDDLGFTPHDGPVYEENLLGYYTVRAEQAMSLA